MMRSGSYSPGVTGGRKLGAFSDFDIQAATPAAGPGGTSVLPMHFASLDELQGLIRASRPSMDWEGAELSAQPVQGSVVSFGGENVRITSTQAAGDYEMEGVLSNANIVLVMAMDIGGGNSMWRTDIGNGCLALVQPRQTIDAVCRANPGYLTVDISREMLEAEFARHDLCLPTRLLDVNTMLDGGPSAMNMAQIRQGVAAMHLGEEPFLPPGYSMVQVVLSSIVLHFSRHCEISGAQTSRSYARIVGRAREFIEAHIDHPISLDELCKASCASKRTPHRAFLEVMDDTPQQFILKQRLNRIRRDLACNDEAERTVTVVSMRWGITELGRLAARYREQFGELPSDTLRRRRAGAAVNSHLRAGEAPVSARLLCSAEPRMRHDLHCRAA